MQIVICRGCDQPGVLPSCSFSPQSEGARLSVERAT